MANGTNSFITPATYSLHNERDKKDVCLYYGMALHRPTSFSLYPVKEHSHGSWMLHLWLSAARSKLLKRPEQLALLSSRLGGKQLQADYGCLKSGREPFFLGARAALIASCQWIQSLFPSRQLTWWSPQPTWWSFKTRNYGVMYNAIHTELTLCVM